MMKKRVYRNWKKVLAGWQSSGLSRREYCKQEGIAESVFYKAQQRLANKQAVCSSGSRSVSNPEVAQSFVEVVESQVSTPMLRITTSSGCVVEVPL